MPKKISHKTVLKNLRRIVALLAALAAVGAIIFLFTRPMLAPGTETAVLDANTDKVKSEGTVFTPDSAGNVNPNVGAGVKADSYLIYNEETGQVLAARNPNVAVAIASLTKLMTAFVVQKFGDLADVWAIGESSTSNIRPVLGLTAGDRVVVMDLVNSMLIGSANDAAAALGDYITSTAKHPVSDLMNQEAQALGMESTHYENPIGFDSEQNYSTADDLKLLLNKVRAMPLFSDIDRRQAYAFTSENGRSYSVKATNTLLAMDPDIHAIKTGYTDEAKGAMITAIHREDRRFIIIVLGSIDRENDTKLLKNQILEQTQN